MSLKLHFNVAFSLFRILRYHIISQSSSSRQLPSSRKINMICWSVKRKRKRRFDCIKINLRTNYSRIHNFLAGGKLWLRPLRYFVDEIKWLDWRWITKLGARVCAAPTLLICKLPSKDTCLSVTYKIQTCECKGKPIPPYNAPKKWPLRTARIDSHLLQGSAKEWSLGCVKRARAAATVYTVPVQHDSARTGVKFPRSVVASWEMLPFPFVSP